MWSFYTWHGLTLLLKQTCDVNWNFSVVHPSHRLDETRCGISEVWSPYSLFYECAAHWNHWINFKSATPGESDLVGVGPVQIPRVSLFTKSSARQRCCSARFWFAVKAWGFRTQLWLSLGTEASDSPTSSKWCFYVCLFCNLSERSWIQTFKRLYGSYLLLDILLQKKKKNHNLLQISECPWERSDHTKLIFVVNFPSG